MFYYVPHLVIVVLLFIIKSKLFDLFLGLKNIRFVFRINEMEARKYQQILLQTQRRQQMAQQSQRLQLHQNQQQQLQHQNQQQQQQMMQQQQQQLRAFPRGLPGGQIRSGQNSGGQMGLKISAVSSLAKQPQQIAAR